MRKKRKKEQIVLEERSKKLKFKLALFFSLFKIGPFNISANKLLCILYHSSAFTKLFSTANKDKLIEKLYQRKCMM